MSGLNSSDGSKAKSVPKKAQKAEPNRKPKASPKVPRKADESIVKSKSEDYEKGTYYLPKELTHEMRIYAVSNRIQMSDLVALAVAEYLENN